MARTNKWRPDVVRELRKHPNKQSKEVAAILSKEFGEPYTSASVRHGWAKYGKDKDSENHNIQTDLTSYLQRGRTLTEVAEKLFIDEATALIAIEDTPDDRVLFRPIDEYGHQCYIWMRTPGTRIEVLPRKWDLHFDQQYSYIVCQFHDPGKRIKLIPIGDVHYGHQAHRHEKFVSTINYIQSHDNVYWFGMGDYMENALDDGRGFSYSQIYQPGTQYQHLTRLLAPIAHKCLFLHPGNHELRDYRKVGKDPTEYLCDMLEIPYMRYPVRCRIIWNEHDWGMRAKHGKTAAQTWGGKLNAAMRGRAFNDFVEFMVSAHTHTPSENPVSCIVEDKANLRIIRKPQYVVVVPSFMEYWGSYAHEADYEPPGYGGIGMHLYSNGKYDAVFKTEDGDE